MNYRRSGKSAFLSAAILFILVCVVGGCADASEPDVRSVEATVVQEDGRFLLIADSTGIRFKPSRIPFSYRENGLRVYVSGRTLDTLSLGAAPEISLDITSLSLRRASNDEAN